jgi:hypothetical protein
MWSRQRDWVERVRLWDVEQDRARNGALLDERRREGRDMVRRHIQISTTMQRLASVELARWINKVGAGDNADLKKAPQLSPEQLQKLLDYAVKLERLNRGEPESITENREGAALSEAQLEERIAHLLKLRE